MAVDQRPRNPIQPDMAEVFDPMVDDDFLRAERAFPFCVFDLSEVIKILFRTIGKQRSAFEDSQGTLAALHQQILSLGDRLRAGRGTLQRHTSYLLHATDLIFHGDLRVVPSIALP